MNKLFTKIGTAMVGIAMAVGVGVAVGRDGFKKAEAAYSDSMATSYTSGNTYLICITSGSNKLILDPSSLTTSFTKPEVVSKTLAAATASDGWLIEDKTVSSVSGKAISFDDNGTKKYLAAQDASSGGKGIKYVTSLSSTALWDVTYAAATKWSLQAKTSNSMNLAVYNNADWRVYAGSSGTQTLELYLWSVPAGDVKPLTITAKQSDDTVIANEGTYSYSSSIGPSTTVQFKVSATYQGGEGYKDGSSFAWTSSNTNVATISASGSTVTATIKDKGTTTITVATSDATTAKSFENISTSFTLDTSGASYGKGHVKNPYTITEALAALSSSSTVINGACVFGKISQVDSYDSTYKSITYWVSDSGTHTTGKILKIYSGKGVAEAEFSAKENLSVGQSVLLCGDLKTYSGTKEMDKNNYIVTDYTTIVTFSNNFRNALSTICADQNADNKSGVSGVWETWKGNFEALGGDDKGLFRIDCFFEEVQNAYKLYAHCVARYSLDTWTGVPASSAPVTLSNASSNNSGFTAIIVIAAVLTTITVGGIFLLRKKEEK